MLALTQATGPSVLQLRTQSVLPADVAPVVLNVLRDHMTDLDKGTLITVDLQKARIRILPIRRDTGGAG
jgi:predicted nuclease of predicted toxin-antitoxin system